MDAYAWWLIAGAASLACAVAAGPFVRRSGVIGLAVTILSVVLIFSAPLLIPTDFVRSRAMASLVSVTLAFKLIDYRRHCRINEESDVGVKRFLRYLIPYPIVLVFGPHERQSAGETSIARDAGMVLLGLALFATLFCGLPLLTFVPVLQQSFLLDHCLKVLLFVAVVESMSLAITSLERLGGFQTTPITRRILLSRSVAEFWLRYNTRMHDWLYANVFQPGGGRRAPVRAVLLTFFVSGLFHEWIFGISTSRFDGYQFAFFMLQAPACLLSPKLQRLARRPSLVGKSIAHAFTIVWFTTTSMLFFHGVNRVFEFTYAAEPWLP
jgi:hypothetical protein